VVKTLIKDKIRFAVFCRSNGVFKKKFIWKKNWKGRLRQICYIVTF
jgi:hypothetical protein